MATPRNPLTLLSWLGRLFRGAGAADSEFAPSMLHANAKIARKKLLQVKRRNDTIRVQELSRLRRLIRSRKNQQPANEDSSLPFDAPPSRTPPTSRLRDDILQKIAGAEAHLTQFWGTTTPPPPIRAEVAPPATHLPPFRAKPPTVLPSDFGDDFDLDFTTPAHPAPPAPGAGDRLLNTHAVVALGAHELCLRDAALHFAEGEFASAQTLLSNQLQRTDIDDTYAELLSFALFEVYRCTGQQALFEALALAYTQRFERSPHEWFALPEPSQAEAALGPAAADTPAATYWACPALLDTTAWAECLLHNPPAGPICRIDWTRLQHIDAPALPALAVQWGAWSRQATALNWQAPDMLAAVLEAGKQAEQPPQPIWWLMHLDLLRLQQQAAAFEAVALDYCRRFELSPPSWQLPANHAETAARPLQLPVGNAEPERADSVLCELRGHVVGYDAPALQALRKAAGQASRVVVSCAQLGRVDMQAASGLLHWTAQRTASGSQVQFIRLPHMVQLFFGLLGLDEYAALSSQAR